MRIIAKNLRNVKNDIHYCESYQKKLYTCPQNSLWPGEIFKYMQISQNIKEIRVGNKGSAVFGLTIWLYGAILNSHFGVPFCLTVLLESRGSRAGWVVGPEENSGLHKALCAVHRSHLWVPRGNGLTNWCLWWVVITRLVPGEVTWPLIIFFLVTGIS